MKILLKLRRHKGGVAMEYLDTAGRAVICVGNEVWHRHRLVEQGGMVPRPFGPSIEPDGIPRLAASMLVARLTGEEVVAPRGMRPDDIAAAFRLAESIFADLAREGLLATDDEELLVARLTGEGAIMSPGVGPSDVAAAASLAMELLAGLDEDPESESAS